MLKLDTEEPKVFLRPPAGQLSRKLLRTFFSFALGNFREKIRESPTEANPLTTDDLAALHARAFLESLPASSGACILEGICHHTGK